MDQPKLQIEFKGGPLDGIMEMYPHEVKATVTVEGCPEGHYQLHARRQGALPPPPEEGQVRVMELGKEDVESRYRYFWITKSL